MQCIGIPYKNNYEKAKYYEVSMSETSKIVYPYGVQKKMLRQHLYMWHLFGQHARLLLTSTWFYMNSRKTDID